MLAPYTKGWKMSCLQNKPHVYLIFIRSIVQPMLTLRRSRAAELVWNCVLGKDSTNPSTYFPEARRRRKRDISINYELDMVSDFKCHATLHLESIVWQIKFLPRFKLKNLTLHLTPIILKTRIITLPAGSFIVYSRFPAMRETAQQRNKSQQRLDVNPFSTRVETF